MNIIFGDEKVKELKDKYTVLELDTIRFVPDGPVATAYSVVENISITDLPLVESWMDLHHTLMVNYGKRNWNFCEQAIEQLAQAWNGELVSFYSELQARISEYQTNDPGPDWSPVLLKNKS